MKLIKSKVFKNFNLLKTFGLLGSAQLPNKANFTAIMEPENFGSSNFRSIIRSSIGVYLLYFSTTSSLSLNNINPVVVYINADTQKLDTRE